MDREVQLRCSVKARLRHGLPSFVGIYQNWGMPDFLESTVVPKHYIFAAGELSINCSNPASRFGV
jgi:hypothetical protein